MDPPFLTAPMLFSVTHVRRIVPIFLIAALLVLPAGGRGQALAHSTNYDPGWLQQVFASAAREFSVPESILLSVGYNESRWEQHGGAPSTSGGYGIMQLTHVDQVFDAAGKGRLR